VDFELSESDAELAEGMRRLLAGQFPLEEIRALESAERVVDRKGWQRLAEAGVFSLRLPESDGGVGLGLAETALVFEELGHALVPGPLVATHLAAGHLEGAADGTLVVGILDLTGVGPGVPPIVEHLADLGLLLVVSDEGVVSVAPSSIEATPLPRPMDPLTPVWSVATLPPGEAVGGPELASLWRREGAVLTAALQVGSAAWSTELAAGYAKERRQFGRIIGSFQAIKHLCADMAVRTEVARCAVHAAAVTADQPDVGDPLTSAATAKLLADEAAIANGRSCIQVHGGMGFTWEVPAHLAYKRARVLASVFGTAGALAESLAESLAAGTSVGTGSA
jgi:alkylation response protein AidB-like acyl-CoA dehydrogenase